VSEEINKTVGQPIENQAAEPPVIEGNIVGDVGHAAPAKGIDIAGKTRAARGKREPTAAEPGVRVPVYIEIKSKQYEAFGPFLGLGLEDDYDFPTDAGPRSAGPRIFKAKRSGPSHTYRIRQADPSSTFELSTDGYLVRCGDMLHLCYDESELTGMDGSSTVVAFDPGQPDMLMMSRTGAYNSLLTFEGGRRHICSYQTPDTPFQICVTTHALDNRITGSGGTLRLEYALEINGAVAERNELNITVSKM